MGGTAQGSGGAAQPASKGWLIAILTTVGLLAGAGGTWIFTGATTFKAAVTVTDSSGTGDGTVEAPAGAKLNLVTTGGGAATITSNANVGGTLTMAADKHIDLSNAAAVTSRTWGNAVLRYQTAGTPMWWFADGFYNNGHTVLGCMNVLGDASYVTPAGVGDFMLSVYSDVSGPAIEIKTLGTVAAALSRPLDVLDATTGAYILQIRNSGEIAAGDATTGTTWNSQDVGLKRSAANTWTITNAGTGMGNLILGTATAGKVTTPATLTLTPSATAGDHTADGSYITFKIGSTAGLTATTSVVVVAGWTASAYNGTYRVYDVNADGVHFRVAKATSAVSSSVGTITHAPRTEDANGTAHWSQAAAPTGPLSGDTWWETDDLKDWTYNGTYWLSKQTFSFISQNYGSAVSLSILVPVNVSYDMYITRAMAHGMVITTNEAGKYWDFTVETCDVAWSFAAITECTISTVTTPDTPSTVYNHELTPNKFVQTNPTSNQSLLRLSSTLTGAAGAAYYAHGIEYRLVHR